MARYRLHRNLRELSARSVGLHAACLVVGTCVLAACAQGPLAAGVQEAPNQTINPTFESLPMLGSWTVRSDVPIRMRVHLDEAERKRLTDARVLAEQVLKIPDSPETVSLKVVALQGGRGVLIEFASDEKMDAAQFEDVRLGPDAPAMKRYDLRAGVTAKLQAGTYRCDVTVDEVQSARGEFPATWRSIETLWLTVWVRNTQQKKQGWSDPQPSEGRK